MGHSDTQTTSPIKDSVVKKDASNVASNQVDTLKKDSLKKEVKHTAPNQSKIDSIKKAKTDLKKKKK